MPQNFNTGTSGFRTDLTTQEPIQAPVYEPDPYQVKAAGEAGAVVGSTLDKLLAGPSDESILGQYASESSDIVSETEGYAQTRQRILDSMADVDPKDKATLDALGKDFESLRNGEIQGAVSPTRASALINNKTKEYINRYPHLAKELRSMRAGFMEDVPRVSGFSSTDKDPDTEAREELMKTAALKKFTLSEEINFRNAQAQNDIQDMEMKARSRAGVLAQPDVTKSVLLRTRLVYTDQVPRLAEAMKNPNFTGKQFEFDLTNLKDRLVMNIDLALSEAQISENLTFDKDYRNALVAQVTGGLDNLIAIAAKTDNPRDRAMLSDNLRKVAENADYMAFREAIGPMATICRGGSDSILNCVGELAKIKDKIQKGLGPSLEAMDPYDIKTKMYLGLIKGSTLEQVLADAIVKTDRNEQHTPTGDPLLDNIQAQASLDVAMLPTTESQKRYEMLRTLAGQPNAFEAWDNRSDVAKFSKGDQQIVDTLRRNSPRILTSSLNNATQMDVTLIQFDALNKTDPFSLPFPEERRRAPAVTVIAGLGPVAPLKDPKYAPGSDELVRELNQHYRVFSNYMPTPELMKWGATTLDELKASKVPGYTPKPETPVTAPKEVAPSEDGGMLPITKSSVPGMLQNGNIDLDNRIQVDNGDGTFSTLRSITIEQDGRYILIPTLNPKGQPLDDDDAVTLYEYTGEHLGIFDTQDAADSFAKKLSQYMERAK